MRKFEVGQVIEENGVAYKIVKRTDCFVTVSLIYHYGRFNETVRETKRLKIRNWETREVFFWGSHTIEAPVTEEVETVEETKTSTEKNQEFLVVENDSVYGESVIFKGTLKECEGFAKATGKAYNNITCGIWIEEAASYYRNRDYFTALDQYLKTLPEGERNKVIIINGRKYSKAILDFKEKYLTIGA